MAEYNFNKDIILGEKGEDQVIKDLTTLGCTLITKNEDNKFDFIMEKNGNQVMYEVKTDVYCRPENDTANMFIEFECRGKESGIMVTKAKWFVTYYKHLNEIWYIKTNELKKIINENEFPITEFSGDANSNTKGWLVPRFQHKKKFIVRNYR
tara:strand:- start:6429 stop:6884 length:456 start_codon:yes stop_codon:yes gene_type:complete